MLTALDVAGRELGFVHGDMRIANIMEHRPRDDAQAGDNEFVPRGFKADVGKLQSADEFKLPGEGSWVLQGIWAGTKQYIGLFCMVPTSSVRLLQYAGLEAAICVLECA